MPDGQPWPLVSIVTPSYNQGQFLEETIRSVLLQGYPNLEYIIIDGGSSDDSLCILQKYEPWLAYWVSEEDRGQSHAINKGFAKSNGEILNWVNSDDLLMPWALYHVSRFLNRYPKVDLVYGNRLIIDESSNLLDIFLGPIIINKSMWGRVMVLPQETCFWRRSLHDEIGALSENYVTIMDQEFFLRAWMIGSIKRVNMFIGSYRHHPETVSSKLATLREQEVNKMIQLYKLYKMNRFNMLVGETLHEGFDKILYRANQIHALVSLSARVGRADGRWRWKPSKGI